MSPPILIAIVVAAALLAFALTPIAARLSHAVGAIDQPGPRKVHRVPTPRLGGLAVIAAIAIVSATLTQSGLAAVLPSDFRLGLLLGLLPVFAISLCDDIRSVPAVLKLSAHSLGAAIAVAYGFRLGDVAYILGTPVSLGVLAIPISWVWIVAVTNAFNLTDGLDGLSAGLAVISAASLATVALVSADAAQGIVSLVIVGALIGFLPWNTYPARIFFGDSGAASVGFLLACLGLWGTARLSSGMAVLVPILLMGVPLTDAVVSIGRRLLRQLASGEGSLFTADEDHIHHRLLRRGIAHPRAVVLLYAVGLAIAVIGVLSVFLTNQRAAIVVVTLLVAAAAAISQLKYDEFALLRKGVVLGLYEMPALQTGTFRVFADLALVALSLYGAFALKFDEWHLSTQRTAALNLLVVFLPITIGVFLAFGVYRRSWRHSGMGDFLLSVGASIASSTAGTLVAALVLQSIPPVSFFIIYTILLTVLTVCARASFRVLMYWRERGSLGGERVLLYGADLQGAMALQEILWRKSGSYHPVGFLDDDPRTHNRVVNGFAVFGGIQSLQQIVTAHQIAGLLLASRNLTQPQLHRIQDECFKVGIWLKGMEMEFKPFTDTTSDAHASRPSLTSEAS